MDCGLMHMVTNISKGYTATTIEVETDSGTFLWNIGNYLQICMVSTTAHIFTGI
jgi:hypothetical protein